MIVYSESSNACAALSARCYGHIITVVLNNKITDADAAAVRGTLWGVGGATRFRVVAERWTKEPLILAGNGCCIGRTP